MPQPDEAIRAYLLGLLPEADVEALEEAYFVDPEAFDRVRAVEDDLLDDYAAGRLGSTEKTAFESRYRASEPLRQRVVAARALRMASVPGVAKALRARSAWTGRVAPLAAAAAFVLAIGWALFWTWQTVRLVPPGPPPSLARVERPTPDPTPTLVPTATPTTAPSAGPVAPATARLVFALSPTLLRGEGGPAQVRFPAGTEAVTLELQGDPAVAPKGAALEVAIETVEGAHGWSGRAQRGKGSVIASVSVPTARLPPADYIATLSAGEQTLYRYFFRVPLR